MKDSRSQLRVQGAPRSVPTNGMSYLKECKGNKIWNEKEDFFLSDKVKMIISQAICKD